MNPIVRMMKRYIKTPLKYALPLLFIGALVLSATTGCIDSPRYEKVGYVSTDYPTSGRSQLVAACIKEREYQAKILGKKPVRFGIMTQKPRLF